ncbi:MAG TPA: haloacid dehalogenase-like hydrolase [Methanocorpusculum sp.]|nr:haloacid dehalogenase-like hydrolase [Methanocorpusculum sp.]
MDVYDFDKTIYDGDSSIDFFLFCIKRHKKILFTLPGLCFAYAKYCFGRITLTGFKERLFYFLTYLPDAEKEIAAFWETHFGKINKWYLKTKKESDIIISASPEFLLAPAAEKLGVFLIASRVDEKTGRFCGENCKGEEKVVRLRAVLPDAAVEKFYSDSLSDEPLAKIAKEAYIVSKDKLVPWNEYRPSTLKKMKMLFFSRHFLMFNFCGAMGCLANFITSLLISLIIHPTIAYVFGYALSLFVTYAFTAKLIFAEKLHPATFGKFVLSYIPNFLIQIAFVALFINILGWHQAIAYILAILIGVPVSFLLVTVFAFRKRPGASKAD